MRVLAIILLLLAPSQVAADPKAPRLMSCNLLSLHREVTCQCTLLQGETDRLDCYDDVAETWVNRVYVCGSPNPTPSCSKDQLLMMLGRCSSLANVATRLSCYDASSAYSDLWRQDVLSKARLIAIYESGGLDNAKALSFQLQELFEE